MDLAFCMNQETFIKMKKIIFTLILILSLICSVSYALRLSSPPKLNLPLTTDDITQINNYLEDLWNLTNGRFSLDIVSTDPTNPKNGDVWILESGSTHRLKWRAGNATYYVDGN